MALKSALYLSQAIFLQGNGFENVIFLAKKANLGRPVNSMKTD